MCGHGRGRGGEYDLLFRALKARLKPDPDPVKNSAADGLESEIEVHILRSRGSRCTCSSEIEQVLKSIFNLASGARLCQGGGGVLCGRVIEFDDGLSEPFFDGLGSEHGEIEAKEVGFAPELGFAQLLLKQLIVAKGRETQLRL